MDNVSCTIIASRIDLDQSPNSANSIVGTMAAFIYRCPNTGLRIQASAAAEITEDEDKYDPRGKDAAQRPTS